MKTGYNEHKVLWLKIQLTDSEVSNKDKEEIVGLTQAHLTWPNGTQVNVFIIQSAASHFVCYHEKGWQQNILWNFTSQNLRSHPLSHCPVTHQHNVKQLN